MPRTEEHPNMGSFTPRIPALYVHLTAYQYPADLHETERLAEFTPMVTKLKSNTNTDST